MKPIVYLCNFKHGTVALTKLIFHSNTLTYNTLKQLDYVHYSHQYDCYYIRNNKHHKIQLRHDLKGIAYTLSKNLIPHEIPNVESSNNHSTNSTTEHTTTPLVSIILINEKAYLKLPYTYEQHWVDYLNSLACIYENKRDFWIIPMYETKKNNILPYFAEQGCKLKIQVKHNTKILTHQQRNSYKTDKEIQSFIKIMTLQGASKRTIENYSSQIKKLKLHYDNKLAAEITDDEIVDYLFFLREELSYSTSAQNIVVSAIKRFLLALTERTINPYHLPRPIIKKALPKVLEKNEIINILKQNLYIKHKCILYLLYATGLRCGELINLKVEDVNFDTKLIIINKGKGNKSRIVSLPDKLKYILSKYLKRERPNHYLFEGQRGGKYSASSVQKIVKNAVQKAGIDKRVTPHMLRHSYATHLHDAGMDIRHIQKLLGHTSTKTTEIYTYISKRDISQLKSPLDDLDI